MQDELSSLLEFKPDRPIIALGRSAADGTVEVTDVLCVNFPPMTNKEMAALSWKLSEWSKAFRR